MSEIALKANQQRIALRQGVTLRTMNYHSGQARVETGYAIITWAPEIGGREDAIRTFTSGSVYKYSDLISRVRDGKIADWRNRHCDRNGTPQYSGRLSSCSPQEHDCWSSLDIRVSGVDYSMCNSVEAQRIATGRNDDFTGYAWYYRPDRSERLPRSSGDVTRHAGEVIRATIKDMVGTWIENPGNRDLCNRIAATDFIRDIQRATQHALDAATANNNAALQLS